MSFLVEVGKRRVPQHPQHPAPQFPASTIRWERPTANSKTNAAQRAGRSQHNALASAPAPETRGPQAALHPGAEHHIGFHPLIDTPQQKFRADLRAERTGPAKSSGQSQVGISFTLTLEIWKSARATHGVPRHQGVLDCTSKPPQPSNRQTSHDVFESLSRLPRPLSPSLPPFLSENLTPPSF